MKQKIKPANDNAMDIEAVASILDWVRPVAASMRSVAIPEGVLQRTMSYLLKQLDKEIGN